MKIISLTLLLISFTINLYADKNWIEIKPENKTKTAKSNPTLEPINKMMKRATIIKELVDSTGKKEKVDTNDKNWFVINNENTK